MLSGYVLSDLKRLTAFDIHILHFVRSFGIFRYSSSSGHKSSTDTVGCIACCSSLLNYYKHQSARQSAAQSEARPEASSEAQSKTPELWARIVQFVC